jgi:hypothetical protein
MTLRDVGIDPTTPFSASSPRPQNPFPIRPTPEQIAGRARAIWEAQGCPLGRAFENFRRAELELLQELNLRS